MEAAEYDLAPLPSASFVRRTFALLALTGGAITAGAAIPFGGWALLVLGVVVCAGGLVATYILRAHPAAPAVMCVAGIGLGASTANAAEMLATSMFKLSHGGITMPPIRPWVVAMSASLAAGYGGAALGTYVVPDARPLRARALLFLTALVGMIIAGAASLALMPADTPTLWLPAVLLAPLLTFSLAALVSDTPALAEIEGENPDEVPLAALVLGSTRASLAAIRAWSGRIGLD